MHIDEINPAKCQYTFRGKNIAYLSQRNMRELARHVGVRSDGSRDEVFTRIVAHLDECGATVDISDVAEAAKLMPLGHLDPAACPFNWQGENIGILSLSKLRIVAKQLGIEVGGVKLKLYKRIVLHLKRIVFQLTRNDLIEIDGIAPKTVRR